LRLGFAGTPQFAIPALEALIRSPHRVAAVFTQPDRPAGRGQAVHLSPVKQRAQALGLTVHQPASFKSPESAQLLRSLDVDALVVVAYGLILPSSVLGIPRLGCFNIHASLLPRWRGAAPVQRALLAGDAASGVTIMRMEAALDTGPVLAVGRIEVAERETGGSLHDRLAALGAQLMVETLDELSRGTAHEEPQSQSGVTYADKIGKSEASIDWREDAAGILRRVRAFNPWPIAQTWLEGRQVRVWDAELSPTEPSGREGPVRGPAVASPPVMPPGSVIAASEDGIDVACGRGALRILRLQLAGRKPLEAREFIKAVKLSGARFADS
jgi:methionyl-tRNA formyltransferase